jgi:hypothetical protein
VSNSAAPSFADDGSPIAVAEANLDRALHAFNRHAILADRYRTIVQRLPDTQQPGFSGATERATLRQARESAVVDRSEVQRAVGELVRLMRIAGAPPEAVLIAVKQRISRAITPATPGAPLFEANSLLSDIGGWTIKAYYDQA